MALSKNSKFILEQLELENSGLVQTNDVLPDRKNEAVDFIDVYEDPASKLDKVQEMYDLLGQINSKKQQIVTLCNQAFNDANCTLDSNEKSLFGDGVILDFEIISANSGGINGTYSDVAANGGSGNGATFNVVVQNNNITSVSISNAGDKYVSGDVLNIKGTDIGLPEDGSDFDLILEVTETDEDELVFSETGKTFRTVVGVFPAPSTFIPVAFGVIRRDDIRVVFYPELENQSSLPQTNNTAEGLIFPRITSGSTNSEYRGKGRATILSANSSFNDGAIDYRIRDDAGNWDADGLKRGSGWSGGDNILGRFYRIKGPCEGRRSQINTLKSEIAVLRAQINGLLPQSQVELLSAINSLKDKKHGYQLQSWSYRRSQRVNNDTISSNNDLKNSINDPNNNNIFG
jgi:hypothetical protein